MMSCRAAYDLRAAPTCWIALSTMSAICHVVRVGGGSEELPPHSRCWIIGGAEGVLTDFYATIERSLVSAGRKAGGRRLTSAFGRRASRATI